MIVTINEKNIHLYNALFAEAYQALPEEKIREDCRHDDKSFHSLEEYFAHIGYLREVDPKFLMLPLDENPFAINANTRTISPQKITILQNDHMAEMVMFTIDRYVDFKDLNEAIIYIQWTNKNGDTKAAPIVVKDITSIPGKIRFGWPLDKNVTAVPGPVHYSVRFWNRLGEEPAEGGAETVVYSLNTLSSSLTITESLQPTINDLGDVIDPNKFFEQAVRNSQYYNGSTPLPMVPKFYEPGLDLPLAANLENNTLELLAEATVSDSGELAYSWHFVPAKDMEVGAEKFEAGKIYEVTAERQSYLDADIDNFVYLPVDETTYDLDVLPGNVKYYVKGTENTMMAYTKITPPAYNAEDQNTWLFRRYTKYIVNDSNIPVIGQYQVRATNTLGSNTSVAGDSGVCQILGPSEIEFEKNLSNHIILAEKEEFEIATAELTVALKQDPHGDVENSYKWYCRIAEDSEWVEQPGAVSESLTITTPGWYKANAIALLNRDAENKDSNECMVTFAPQIPAVEYGEGMADLYPDDDFITIHNPLNTNSTLKVIASVNIDEAYNGYSNNLFSNGFVYSWYLQKNDSPKVEELKAGNKIVVEGLGTPELTVKPTVAGNYTFICRVANKLGDQVSDIAELGFLIIAT